MVTLSYERYRAVVKPLLRRLTHKFAKGLIIVIWVLSYILFALPKSFMYELSIGHGMLHCDPVYRSLTGNIFMKIWLFIFILILPCAVICWCYNRVMRTLMQDLQLIGDACPSRDFPRFRAKRNAKMMRILSTMVFVFIISYFPFNVMLFLNLYPEFRKWHYNETVETICRMLQVSHSCANPVVLYLLSNDFRKALRKVFLRFHWL